MMSHDKKPSGGRYIVGAAALAVAPAAAVGTFGILTGRNAKDIGDLITQIGILPGLLVIGFAATTFYVNRKDQESQTREEQMRSEALQREQRLRQEALEREARFAKRLDTVEDRYHGEMVALTKQSIEAMNSSSRAVVDLNKTINDLHRDMDDRHRETMLILTKRIDETQVTVVTPAKPSEVQEVVKDLTPRPKSS
jgi:hypothetical protein